VPNDLDLRMMARCIELSRDSIAAGELPFGCVICHDEEVVSKPPTAWVRDGDVTRHAEMVAMSESATRPRNQAVVALHGFIPLSSPARCAATGHSRDRCARCLCNSLRPSWADTRDGRFYRTRRSLRHPGSFRPRPEIAGAVMRERQKRCGGIGTDDLRESSRSAAASAAVAQSAAEVPRREGFSSTNLLHR